MVGRKTVFVSATWLNNERNWFLQLRAISAVFTLIWRKFTPRANKTVDEKLDCFSTALRNTESRALAAVPENKSPFIFWLQSRCFICSSSELLDLRSLKKCSSCIGALLYFFLIHCKVVFSFLSMNCQPSAVSFPFFACLF